MRSYRQHLVLAGILSLAQGAACTRIVQGTIDNTGATGAGAPGTGASGTSAGISAGTGTGSATGNNAGSGSGGNASAGASSGGKGPTGGANGTSTGSGATGGAGSSASGGSTGGKCTNVGFDCKIDSDCCSGGCYVIDDVGTCAAGVGGSCLSGDDCVSATCTNDACACSPGFGQCTADGDCCNGVDCQCFGTDCSYKFCCNPGGGTCQSQQDCCNLNCVDGGCACLPLYGSCAYGNTCCSGICWGYCRNGPGAPCQFDYDCSTASCVKGSCSTCAASGGLCGSTADCCTGGVCASYLAEYGGYGNPVLAADAGQVCCSPTGAACNDDAGVSGFGGCCSGTCTDGACVCAGTKQFCTNDQACCAGGLCEPYNPTTTTYGEPACCQADDQLCYSAADCCSNNCQNKKCACVPTGGLCGDTVPQGRFVTLDCCSGSCTDAGTCG